MKLIIIKNLNIMKCLLVHLIIIEDSSNTHGILAVSQSHIEIQTFLYVFVNFF